MALSKLLMIYDDCSFIYLFTSKYSELEKQNYPKG